MPKNQKISLLIGIDNYENPGLEQLKSCKNDAINLNSILVHIGYNSFKGSPIIGSQIPRKEAAWTLIREAICDFFSNAKPAQTLLFYFSGHGVHGENDIFLGSPEIDPEKPRKAGFALSELTKCMDSSRSNQIVGIIDACYSGGAGLPDIKLRKKAADDGAEIALSKYREAPKMKGKTLLLSSQSYEKSNALKNSNSLYTKYLVEGLKGVRDKLDIDGTPVPNSVDEKGNITPQSLHNYVYHYVASRAYQKPIIRNEESSQIIIASYPQLLKLHLESADLSQWVTLRNQGNEEISTALAFTTATEISLARQGKPITLSARYVNEKAKKIDNPKRRTLPLYLGVFVSSYFGIPPESVWQYQPNKKSLPNGKTWEDLDSAASHVKTTTYRLKTLSEIPKHLTLGRPIITEILTYKSTFLYANNDGELKEPSRREKSDGAYPITIVKYDGDSGTYYFVKSWGAELGKRGFFSMNEEVAATTICQNGIWAVEAPLLSQAEYQDILKL